MVRKKMRFGSALNLQNQVRVQARARFSVFNPSQKKLHFRVVLDLHFGAFVSSIRRKQGFQGCLVFKSIFNVFWTPQNGSTTNENRSSGSSWAKMAPRRCHLEPTWLQEPVFHHFKLMSDRFGTDICSPQEPIFTFFEQPLHHFRLMSDQFWIDVFSILIWIGLMFTRC